MDHVSRSAHKSSLGYMRPAGHMLSMAGLDKFCAVICRQMSRHMYESDDDYAHNVFI